MNVSRILTFAMLGATVLLITSCGPDDVQEDLSDRSWKLVDQDSVAVTFPDDFEGQILVTGYIFTNCQGVCPAITTNMKNISKRTPEGQNVQFVGITFDPMRDSPSVLENYMEKLDLDKQSFTFLTGDSATVYSLLDRVGIRTEIQPDTSANSYKFNHTNQINVIDRQGRIRTEYGGSMVPPEHVVEDINKLQ